MFKHLACLSSALVLASLIAAAAPPADAAAAFPLKSETFEGLAWRSIGPALMSGRVIDLAVDPRNKARYFVAVASGGVWKTINSGTTFTPVFDKEGSFSIGCVALDPQNPHVVWVGTGENNSQRSVAFGDGVYRSDDGGNSWKNLGLKNSEHIGKVVVDPRDSNTVYVAAQGPLWNPGGDRGLYKTEDGGKTWQAVLTIGENTGVSDLVYDPRNPDVLLASAYQRRRHVWTLINGGPESALYKSTDAGKSWRKITAGLPEVDLGRIGLAVSPADPDVIYATVEAADGKGGIFRSRDRGETWEKRNDYQPASPQYYAELIADPKDPDRVYSMDVWMMVTEDGGKSWKRVGEKFKHVDNHALWIDPLDTDYLLAGCDGGVYETWDRGATWHFKANLPVTQFYRGTVDNSLPFYYVYGGTQDNCTQGGPSRTISASGITNADWFITVGGDGFKTETDPENPNIVYSQWQYGNLVRFDRQSGERVSIKPQEGRGEPALRFNWDSPLIISPHNPQRLYFAAEKIFQSDDRGDHWKAISPDLTRQIDRNQLPVMGRIWGPDAVAKSASTSFFGNIVQLGESPLQEGLLYAGTDDGLIQVTEDGGKNWRKAESFPGVPEGTYVTFVGPSRHAARTVFAAFSNHKMGDFRPYVLKSEDAGRSWVSIASDLPARGMVYSLAEDGVDAQLLFVGTEFGVFFTRSGGRSWVRLKGGIPTIAVREILVQRRENDLVAATFGRGFYILDDYTPLRLADEKTLQAEATLFPVRRALAYIPSTPLGGEQKAALGDSFYTAENPPFGAVFTYFLKEGLKTAKEKRQEAEKEAQKQGKTLPYPSLDQLRAESEEQPPAVVLTVADEAGRVVRRLEGPRGKGFHRVAWDLRYPAANPARLETAERDPWDTPPAGPLVVPGNFTVTLAFRLDGALRPLPGSQEFQVTPLNLSSLPPADLPALLAFQEKVGRLQRAVLGARDYAQELNLRLNLIQKAIHDAPRANPVLPEITRDLQARLGKILISLRGDDALRARNENTPTSIVERVQAIVESHYYSTAAPTGTMQEAYAFAAAAFQEELARLRIIAATDLPRLEKSLEEAQAPWTPGRIPEWKPE